MNNMIALAPSLGCANTDTACLCKNVNFQYGIRDCSNAVCGEAVASTVISFGAGYCHGKQPKEIGMIIFCTLLTWTNRCHRKRHGGIRNWCHRDRCLDHWNWSSRNCHHHRSSRHRDWQRYLD